MDLNQYATLTFWNELVLAHLTELTLILTAALVALADRYARRFVAKMTSSVNAVARFAAFLLLCTVGYASLALGLSWLLKSGLAAAGGAYMAPIVAGVVLLVAVEAQRQKQT
jgi:hypothetical protein